MQRPQIINGEGFDLHLLSADSIELMRQWRNDPKIRQYMIFRGEITPEQQKKWFASVDNDHNLYYIISIDNCDAGCANIKDIDYEEKHGEAGIFIYADEARGRHLSQRSLSLLMQYAFRELGLKYITARILHDNTPSIRCFKRLGFEIDSSSADGILHLSVTHEKFVPFD